MSRKIYGQGNEEYITRSSALLILGILVAVGLWLRVRNLGHLSLLADEGIEALAVEGILQHGIPKVDSGLVYVRWPLYLYIQAALAWIFELNEFWLRLPSAVFGALAIVPAYVLGRDLFDRPVGLLVATILAFSVWEIELSRYARGYTIYQFFFLVCLILFYYGFMLNKKKYRIWFLLAAIITLFTHELSDLLVVLFAIPVLSPAFDFAEKLRSVAWGGGVAAMVIARKKLIGFQLPDHLVEIQTDTGGVVDQITRTLGLPPLNLPETVYFLEVFRENTFLLGVMAFVAIVSTIFLIYLLYRERSYIRFFLSVVVVWASFFHQFAISVIFIFFQLLIFRREYRLKKNMYTFVSASVTSLLLVSWFSSFYFKFTDLSSVIILKNLFGFPDLYDYMIDWLLGGWPIISIFLAVGSLLLFVRHLKEPDRLVPIFSLGSFYITALAASLFDSFQVPRYFFHLYPLIIVISSWVIYEAVYDVLAKLSFRIEGTPWIATLVCIPVLMLASQDAYPVWSWNVGERTYQSKIDPYRGPVSWEFYARFHQDLKSPSLYVQRHATEGDEIVVLEPEHMAAIYPFYLKGIDYYVAAEENIHRDALIKKNPDGKSEYIHYITGTKIVTTKSELESIIDKKEGAVWIIADKRLLKKENPIYPPKVSNFMADLRKDKNIKYIGKDGIMHVLKIE